MSLALALEQIQKPSWQPVEPPKRLNNAHHREKRKEVLRAMQAHGKPVSYAWIVDYAGYAKQSVQNIVASLVNEGRVRRIESGTSNGIGVLFEAVAQELDRAA